MSDDQKPGLAPDAKSLAEKIGIWLACALLAWIVVAAITVGTVFIIRWLF